jgi:hypothetical protein
MYLLDLSTGFGADVLFSMILGLHTIIGIPGRKVFSFIKTSPRVNDLGKKLYKHYGFLHTI